MGAALPPSAKLTLGPVDFSDRETKDEPVIGSALTLRAARQLANKIDRQRAMGLDVIEEHKAARSRQRAAAADRAANTFGSCAREFFAAYKTRRRAGATPRPCWGCDIRRAPTRRARKLGIGVSCCAAESSACDGRDAIRA